MALAEFTLSFDGMLPELGARIHVRRQGADVILDTAGNEVWSPPFPPLTRHGGGASVSLPYVLGELLTDATIGGGPSTQIGYTATMALPHGTVVSASFAAPEPGTALHFADLVEVVVEPVSTVQILRDEAVQAANEAAASAASVNREQPLGVAGLDASGKLFVSRIPDGLPYLSATTRAVHAPALGMFFPEAEGAVGDGVTDDSAAFAAAASAAGTSGVVHLRPGATYALGATFAPGSETIVKANGATIKATGTLTRLIDFAGRVDCVIEDATIDLAGIPATSGIRLGTTGSANNRLFRVDVRSTAGTLTSSSAAEVTTGAVDCRMVLCTFDGINVNNVRIHADTTRTRIHGCDFSDWGDRAILVLGTATGASVDLHIVGNTIRDVSTTFGDPRQPIAIQGVDTALHQGVRVTDNTIIGNGLAHHDGGGVQLGGTADAISLHRCQDFIVARNVLRDNGEVGITISQNSRDGEVTDNVVTGSNTDGIVVGVPGTSCQRVSVHGNQLRNNGQESGQSPPRQGTQAGIWMADTTDCAVFGNMCGDDQGTPTQLAAVYAIGNSGLTIGHNPLSGGTTRLLHEDSSGNTTTVWDVPPLRQRKTSDQTVNNSTTLTAIAELSQPLETGGVYEGTVYLPYNSSTVADLALSWSTPAGSTMTWTADAPAGNAGAANTTIGRLLLSEASTYIIGGTGGDAVALPAFTLTVGATGGNLALRFAQGTAEATDTKILAGARLKLERVG